MKPACRFLTFLPILLSISTISPAQADLVTTSAQPLVRQQQVNWKTAQNNRALNRELNMPMGNVSNLAKELSLSPDQIQRLQKLRESAQNQTKERRQTLQKSRQELAQLIQGSASSDQIRQKRQQVQSLQREVGDINFEQTLAIREILTPEQRTKLQEIMKQRRQNRPKFK
jgi:periplasmic protein CpxP/Spy